MMVPVPPDSVGYSIRVRGPVGYQTLVPLPPPVRDSKEPRGAGGQHCPLVSLQGREGPFEGAETDSPFALVWGSAWELVPCHRGVTTDRGPPLRGLGFCAGWACVLAGRPETMGGCGPGRGLA